MKTDTTRFEQIVRMIICLALLAFGAYFAWRGVSWAAYACGIAGGALVEYIYSRTDLTLPS